MNKFLFAVAIASVALASGCSTSYKPNVYQSGQAMAPMRVKMATVIDVREVEIAAPASGAGGAAGSAVGATLGVGTGNNGRGGIIGGIAGAVIGGVAGTLADKAVNQRRGIEIVYQLDGSQDTMALVQEIDDSNPIRKGDHIRIMEGSFAARAVRVSSTL